ncbi:hypothetical protein Daus18300_008071 [Diaporthe australafricana]|uniref:DNA2/NAM7 helicase-like C-terminal domain-containing protein n=1 Tax=Diaporthe australafricana TaxID=127596 RepID=A0ABR3WKC1_9PEZI
MLEHNYRQHGIAGDFFNEFFYNADANFIEADDQLGPLEILAGKKEVLGDTLMSDLDSHESSEARSFLSPTHVNFALAKVAEHCLDPTFAPNKKGKVGKVIIIAPYEAQRNLYTYDLKKRASVEKMTNEN